MEPSRERDGVLGVHRGLAPDRVASMEPSRERDGVLRTGAARGAPARASMEPSRERDGVLGGLPGVSIHDALQWSRRANATE